MHSSHSGSHKHWTEEEQSGGDEFTLNERLSTPGQSTISILSVEDVDHTNYRSTVKEIIKTTSLQQLRQIPDDQRVLNILALQQ